MHEKVEAGPVAGNRPQKQSSPIEQIQITPITGDLSMLVFALAVTLIIFPVFPDTYSQTSICRDIPLYYALSRLGIIGARSLVVQFLFLNSPGLPVAWRRRMTGYSPLSKANPLLAVNIPARQHPYGALSWVSVSRNTPAVAGFTR
jgi:hypothetical protein